MNSKFTLQDGLSLSNSWRMNAVNHILMTWQGIIITFFIIVLIVGIPNITTNLSLGIGVVVTWICLRLNRQGRTHLAVGISSTVYCVATAVSTYAGGALDTMAWTLFIPIILMVSLFINARVGIIISLLVGLYLTFLAWGMESNIVPPLGYTLNTTQKYIMSITPFCLIMIASYFIAQAMEQAFRSIRKQKELVDEYADHLELLNSYLARSEARLRTIMENAADGIIVASEDGQLILANSQFCDWVNYTVDELLTMTVDQIKEKIAPDLNIATLQKAFQDAPEDHINTISTTLYRKNGSTFPIEACVVRMELNRENVLLGTVRDVTKRELTQAELKRSLHEKELLLREIHHRVKNNLQIVTSMLRIQGRQLTDHVAIEANRTLQSRVRSMAIIHQQLYQTTNLSNINFANYIRTLVNDIKTIHDNDLIQFEYELDQVNLTVDHALTAGLIVTELVTNVFKHAFSDGQFGVVRCNLKKEDPFVVITIRDSGKGGVTQEQVSTSRTMGMQLLRLHTNQLKGNLDIHSESDAGTRFVLTFEDQLSY